MLAFKDDGNSIEIDYAETKQRREQAQSKLEARHKASLSGEITL